MQTPFEPKTRLSHAYALVGLLLLVVLGTALSSLLMQGVAQSVGSDYSVVVNNLTTNNQLRFRNIVRLASIISQCCTFLLPSLFIVWWFHPRRVAVTLKLKRFPRFSLIVLGVFFLFAIFPIAQWLLIFNKSLPLPDWASSLEKDLGNLATALLVMESPWELIFNLITIAFIPALGEELLFRGVLQQKLTALTQKPHLSICLAAIIFSAVHGQFEGFLPRLALGAALGYLLYWTNNLWIPIIAHFFNNALQVVFRYFADVPVQADPNANFPLLLLVVSIILAAVLAYLLINFNRKQLV